MCFLAAAAMLTNYDAASRPRAVDESIVPGSWPVAVSWVAAVVPTALEHVGSPGASTYPSPPLLQRSTVEYIPACTAPLAPLSPNAPHSRAAGGFVLGPCPACPNRCTSPVGWRSLAHSRAPTKQHPGAAPAHDTVCLWRAMGVHHNTCVPWVGSHACRRDSATGRRNSMTSQRCASVGHGEVRLTPPPPPRPDAEDCAQPRLRRPYTHVAKLPQFPNGYHPKTGLEKPR